MQTFRTEGGGMDTSDACLQQAVVQGRVGTHEGYNSS